MNIERFISNFKNHPILFIGTGMSLRYLNNSYTWDTLLEKISIDFKENDEYYLDIKSKYYHNEEYKFENIAYHIEKDFNEFVLSNKSDKFKFINDLFYENMRNNINISRFKLYISQLLNDISYKEDKYNEIVEFKKVRKNISSVITTNYDIMMEDLFSFNSLVGNNILLSNPYGSLYKIHGCITQPEKIIITKNDYEIFNKKYKLIRAQLLSLFIHNPIIFLGYSLKDINIKQILKTIFSYVDYNSIEAKNIKDNFLLVEYDKNNINNEVYEYDIDIEGISTIQINRIKTDDYITIYKCLSKLDLPISAMDIRKVQNIVKEIYNGTNSKIKVSITEDLDELENSDKVLVIGSEKTITYYYQNSSEIIKKYFQIIEEENTQILDIIDQIKIQKKQYFPIFIFSTINKKIKNSQNLKEQQKSKIEKIKNDVEKYLNNKKIEDNMLTFDFILSNDEIGNTQKNKVILYAALIGKFNTKKLKDYIINQVKSNTTDYRMLICVYDYLKFKEQYKIAN